MSKMLAKIQCCFLGMGQLLAWNTILTIEDYYYEIFPDYHPAHVLTLVYQPLVLGTIFILLFLGQKHQNRRIILTGYCLFVIGTIFLISVDLASKGKGGLIPFVLLCSVVAGFGVANALVEGAMIGELSNICPDLIQPFAAGLGIAGVTTSVLRLLTKAVFQNSPDGLRKGALVFLAISFIVELMSVVIYGCLFPKLSVVKNYRASVSNETAEESRVPHVDKLELAQDNIDKVISLFATYALTLSIFPGFLYENTGKHTSWYPLLLITCFNVCDALSRYIVLINRLKMESGKWIIVCVVSRVLLVPAFYFTAKYSGQGWMIFLTSFLGISNGYLTVCTLTGTSKRTYNASEANALGNMLVGSMLSGIFAGICLSWLWLIGSKISF